MKTAKYNLPDIKRGDTWASRNILTITDNDDNPIAITSARMMIRHRNTGVLIYAWQASNSNITVTDNVVNISRIPISSSASFPVGNGHKWDLEITLPSGEVWTILEGLVNITEDISR